MTEQQRTALIDALAELDAARAGYNEVLNEARFATSNNTFGKNHHVRVDRAAIAVNLAKDKVIACAKALVYPSEETNQEA